MSFFVPGNVPYNSTQVPATDPSTAALLAELDSTTFQLNTNTPRERIYAVYAYLGGSTGAYWAVESAASTVISTYVTRYPVRTASGQTSQFVFKFRLTAPTDRIRAHLISTTAGTYDATLMAEEIT